MLSWKQSYLIGYFCALFQKCKANHFLNIERKQKWLSPVRLFVTPWTKQSMEFSRQDLSNPRIEPRYPTLQADSLPAEPQEKPKNTGVGSLSLLQGLFHTGIEPGSPALQADSLPTELSGKPFQILVNTYIGLSLVM